MHISNQINTVPYLGSKFSVLPWLLPKLPHTLSFTEVFGGSMVVMMNKPPCQIETYNDINSGVVNFFRVLRDYPEELISKLYLTPHSREEYDEAWENDQDDPIEKARKYFVRMRQSFYASGAQKQKKGWLSATRQTRCKVSEATNKYLQSVDGLHQIVERLKMIQIEHRDWRWILNAYDTPTNLFYLDPPYDYEKRSSTCDYEHDFKEADHVELKEVLSSRKSLWCVSGYDSKFMKDLYKGYYFTKGPIRKNNKTDIVAHECIWTNYDPAENLPGRLF